MVCDVRVMDKMIGVGVAILAMVRCGAVVSAVATVVFAGTAAVWLVFADCI